MNKYRTLRSYFCWLFGHSFICMFHWHWGTEERRSQGGETTGWACQHCGMQREEQWDT